MQLFTYLAGLIVPQKYKDVQNKIEENFKIIKISINKEEKLDAIDEIIEQCDIALSFDDAPHKYRMNMLGIKEEVLKQRSKLLRGDI